jgi:hypothetical protein
MIFFFIYKKNQYVIFSYTGVFEIRVLILTTERTRQFMKHNILQNSQKFYKIFCAPIFTKRVILCVFITMRILILII